MLEWVFNFAHSITANISHNFLEKKNGIYWLEKRWSMNENHYRKEIIALEKAPPYIRNGSIANHKKLNKQKQWQLLWIFWGSHGHSGVRALSTHSCYLFFSLLNWKSIYNFAIIMKKRNFDIFFWLNNLFCPIFLLELMYCDILYRKCI